MVDIALTSVTQSLAVNAYQFCSTIESAERSRWFEKREAEFTSRKLSIFVRSLGETLGAKILNLSSTDYEPFGASAALLIGQKLAGEEVLAHLDASHIAAHTYFDASDHCAQFRLEVEVSSCGGLSPIALIKDILNDIRSDFVQIDYRVRGLSWTEQGLPKLAEDTSELKAFSAPGFDSLVLSETSSKNVYIELARKNIDSELSDLLVGLRSKPSR